MAARTNLELITEKPGTSGGTSAGAPRSMLGPLAVGTVALALAAAWGWLGASTMDQGLTRLDEIQLGRASAAWDGVTKDAMKALEDEARVLVDDIRIREPLATPGIDDATLMDLMQELKTAAGASIMGIVGTGGSVRVVAGADTMKGVDIGGSSLMKPGGRDLASGTWLFPDRLLAVAVAPVRLGDNIVGFLMIGRDVGSRALALVDQATGVGGGILFQQKLVTSAPGLDARATAAITEAATLDGEQTKVVAGGELVARTARLDEGRGGKIVWLLPRRHAKSALSIGPATWWAPAVFVLAAVMLWSVFEYRRGSPGRGRVS